LYRNAYLRLHLLPPHAQLALQELFRRYVDSRLETYRRLRYGGGRNGDAESKKIQEEVWSEAVAATRLSDSHPSAGLLLLPALNNMIDISTTRTMALQLHPPRIIYALLFGLDSYAPCWLVLGCRVFITGVASYPRFHPPHGHSSFTSCSTSSTHARV